MTGINRRLLIASSAGFLASVSLPRFALALPSIDEVAHDVAIPALANPQGDVTIAEIVDYQCPYCKLSYLEIMKLVAEDPGIRLVMKDWPVFGQPPNSPPALCSPRLTIQPTHARSTR